MSGGGKALDGGGTGACAEAAEALGGAAAPAAGAADAEGAAGDGTADVAVGATGGDASCAGPQAANASVAQATILMVRRVC
jgi:hypothetical protein